MMNGLTSRSPDMTRVACGTIGLKVGVGAGGSGTSDSPSHCFLSLHFVARRQTQAPKWRWPLELPW